MRARTVSLPNKAESLGKVRTLRERERESGEKKYIKYNEGEGEELCEKGVEVTNEENGWDADKKS